MFVRAGIEENEQDIDGAHRTDKSYHHKKFRKKSIKS